ncbi:MAG TPA: 4Fe-4S dicluster-binding protein [Gemmatimonadales bacterium]|nr:4Fe-4S dicluster-binding protein [Gemmatimonadales bacterium]
MRRMTPAAIAAVDLAVCDRCGLCLPLCPPAALQLERNVLTVERSSCTGCEKCIAPCPVGALTMVAYA